MEHVFPRTAAWKVVFDRGSSMWVFAPLSGAMALLTYYAYRYVVAQDVYFSSTGFFAYPPARYTVAISVLYALLPLLWLRRQLKLPSDICVLYLYFFVYVPSCVLMPVTVRSSLEQILLFLTALLAAFGAVEARRWLQPLTLPQAPPDREGAFIAALVALVLTSVVILFYFGDVNLANLQLFDVYERRAVLLNSQSAASRAVLYAANWLSLALVPVLLTFGLHRKKLILVAIALVAALIGFAATSFKTHLYLPILIGLFYLLLRRIGYRFVGLGVLVMALALTVGPLVWDAVANDMPLATWTLQFRFIGNNGYLTSKYFDFFHDMPKGYFTDTFGRFLFDAPYNIPLAQVVGESLGGLRGNHANAHLWADGFGNLGFPGLFFATGELVLFFWLLDSVSDRKNVWIVTPALLSPSFSLANTAVHTTITSNGAFLLLLSIALLPRQHSDPADAA